MQTLVLTDRPRVRSGLSALLEQRGHHVDAPHVESIGAALELMQDTPYPLVIIDDGWCDGVRLSLLVARLAPQHHRVHVAVLHRPHPPGTSNRLRGEPGITFRMTGTDASDPCWQELDQLLRQAIRPALFC